MNNNGWMKVARSGKTLLTPVMIQEIVDPMSASMAITHFSEQVESVMRLFAVTYACGGRQRMNQESAQQKGTL